MYVRLCVRVCVCVCCKMCVCTCACACVCSDVQVPFPSERLAHMALCALVADKELRPDRVQRDLSLQGPLLTAVFSGRLAKDVRVSATSFFESLLLILDVQACFDEDHPHEVALL